MGYVRKNVTIRPEQEEWLQTQPINLSKLIQQKLDELMGKPPQSLGGGAV